MAEVVTEADRLDEILVEAQRPRHRARDLRDLERVRHPRAVVVALGRDEDLRLVLQAAKGLAVHDAVAVALQRRAQRAIGLVDGANRRIGARRERRELLLLPRPASRREALGDDARCGVGVHPFDSRSLRCWWPGSSGGGRRGRSASSWPTPSRRPRRGRGPARPLGGLRKRGLSWRCARARRDRGPAAHRAGRGGGARAAALRGARRGEGLLAQSRRVAPARRSRAGQRPGLGRRRRRAARRGRRQRPGRGRARRRHRAQRRLGAAGRGRHDEPRRAARGGHLRAGRHAARRRPHGAARAGDLRLRARQARARDRRERRRRALRRAARGARRRARHGCLAQRGARPRAARARRGGDRVRARRRWRGEFDAVIEGVGGATLGAALQRVAGRGIVVSFASSDTDPASFPDAGAVRTRAGRDAARPVRLRGDRAQRHRRTRPAAARRARRRRPA